jgi:hypothetical protein
LFYIQTFRLNKILDVKGIRISFWELYKIQLIGLFYGTITPAKAGSLIRIGYISRIANRKISQCSTAVFVEKMLDTISVFLFASAGGMIIFSRHKWITLQALILLSLVILLFMILYNKGRVKRILSFMIGFLPKRYTYNEGWNSAFHEFYDYMPYKRDILIPFLLSVFNWVVIYSINYVIVMAIGVNIDYLDFIFIYPIATIIGLIPITVAGFGTREAALIALFSGMINPVKIVSISLLSVAMCSLPPALLGWGFSMLYRSDNQ